MNNLNSNSIIEIKNKKVKILIPAIIVIAVIIITIVIIFALSSKSVNIDDYIIDNIKFSGYDGYGEDESGINIIDYDKLIADLEIQSTNALDMLGAEIVLEDYIDVSFSTGEQPQNLKNGDNVTYVITVDYDKINASGFEKKLKGKEKIKKSYEVSGLEKTTEINPFDAIEKVFVSEKYGSKEVSLQFKDKINDYEICTESNTELSYSFKFKDEEITVAFDVPNVVNITAGDKIKISLQDDYEKYANKGVKFAITEKEFSVLTADVLDDSSKITKASYDILKDLFDEYTENENGDEYSFVNLYYYSQIGNYTKIISNEIIAIYKFKSSAVGSGYEYVYLCAKSPLIDSDGEIVKSSIEISCSTDSGYNSVDELENKLGKSEEGITVTTFEKIVF